MRIMLGIIGKKFFWLLLAFMLLAVSPVAAADDELDASRERLDQIQQQIEETLRGLHSKKSQSGVLSEDLERLDAETRRIERLTKKSNQQLSELDDRLEKQRQTLQEIEEQRDQTEQQIRVMITNMIRSIVKCRFP